LLSAVPAPPSTAKRLRATSAGKGCASRLAHAAAGGDVEGPYLPVKIGPLNAECPGRVADASVMLFEYRRNVVALEARARLAQGAAVREHHRVTAEPDVGEHVFEADAPSAGRPGDHVLDERAQLDAVPAPRQRRNQRQRRARARFGRAG